MSQAELSGVVVFVVVVVIAQPAQAVASLHHGPAEWPVSRGWQGQIHCRCGVALSSPREDDQDDVSSPCQVNDWMLGQRGNGCVLESPE